MSVSELRVRECGILEAGCVWEGKGGREGEKRSEGGKRVEGWSGGKGTSYRLYESSFRILYIFISSWKTSLCNFS